MFSPVRRTMELIGQLLPQCVGINLQFALVPSPSPGSRRLQLVAKRARRIQLPQTESYIERDREYEDNFAYKG